MKQRRIITILVALVVLANLLACTIDGGGDWSDMDRGWMEETVEAAERCGGSSKAPCPPASPTPEERRNK